MLEPEDRAHCYNNSEFGTKYPGSKLHVDNGKIYGVWMSGQNYQTKSALYGAYPSSYLPRITKLFPYEKEVLHLFSGSLPPGDYIRFDCKPERDPDVIGDAHNLSEYLVEDAFDVIYADPPYSTRDAEEHYDTPMVNRKKCVHEAWKVLKKGGWLVWMDEVWPMFKKTELTFRGAIPMIRSTNHRVRAVFLFEKV